MERPPNRPLLFLLRGQFAEACKLFREVSDVRIVFPFALRQLQAWDSSLGR